MMDDRKVDLLGSNSLKDPEPAAVYTKTLEQVVQELCARISNLERTIQEQTIAMKSIKSGADRRLSESRGTQSEGFKTELQPHRPYAEASSSGTHPQATSDQLSCPSQDQTTFHSGPPSMCGEEMEEDEGVDIPDDMLKDHYCDPDHPMAIHFRDVSAAAYRIKDGVQKTPCTISMMSRQFGMELYFKKEFLHYTGSFKERGARYTLLQLSKEQHRKGVIAASAGNHALALSYHGQELGVSVTVVMPIVAPLMKVEACRHHGAHVIIKGNDISECKKVALRIARKQGLTYINGYDHPNILAGQGTMGLEILEQVPDLDACIIPVGGGGLIAGTALAIKSLKPSVRIYGVESEKCASFSAALEAGHPVHIKCGSTLADGLAVPMVGVNAFETAKSLVDQMLVVKEENIALSILHLIEQEKAVVEGAGAIGLAALTEGLVPELKGKKVVVALCGGNIDTTALGRVLERGLAAEGRLVRFVVTVSDRPGGVAELTQLISNLGISIKDILHERAWLKSDVFSVQVKCVVETRDKEHGRELEKKLRTNYAEVLWGPEMRMSVDVD